MIIMDFSKAFDTVPHKRLLGKLEQFGICGDVHSWIASFLTNRKQSVVVDGLRSKEADVAMFIGQIRCTLSLEAVKAHARL